jgi:hypothetical protein
MTFDNRLCTLSVEEASHVDDVWLDIWKRRIVRCWTNKVMHYGMHSTSRVQGCHSTLIAWITPSTSDLLTLHTRMVHWWRNSLHKYKTAVSDAQAKTKSVLCGALFAKVVKVVHAHALTSCLDNIYGITGNTCSGEYTAVMGLPCTHKLRQLQLDGACLQAIDFDAHWWIDRTTAPPSTQEIILEPRRIADLRAEWIRARHDRQSTHSRGRGRESTRRVPSGFELSQTRDHRRVAQLSLSAPEVTGPQPIQPLPRLSDAITRGERNPRRLPPLRFHPFD